MKKAMVKTHHALAWIALTLVAVQFVTAGLLVFPGILGDAMEQYYGFHALPGMLAGLAGLLLMIAALAGWVGGSTIGASVVFFLLLVAQGFLARAEPRLIGALHTTNALILLYLSHELARGRFRAPDAM